MTKRSLPPQVGSIDGGAIEWKKLDDIDFELLGYFLSSHLIVEHYIDELLKVLHGDLDWQSARLTFAQKSSLLSKFKMPDKYNSWAAINHLNSLRNKLSHRVGFRIEPADLVPFRDYLSKIYEDKQQIPTEPHELLEAFTGMVCVYFAGFISGQVSRRKPQLK